MSLLGQVTVEHPQYNGKHLNSNKYYICNSDRNPFSFNVKYNINSVTVELLTSSEIAFVSIHKVKCMQN